MADKKREERSTGRTERPEGQTAGYEPVGETSAKQPAEGRPLYTLTSPETMETPEGTVDVRSPGDPGLWEEFRLTNTQVDTLYRDKRREKAIRDGNVVAAGWSPEEYLRFLVREALEEDTGQPVYERARLETELRKRLKALGD